MRLTRFVTMGAWSRRAGAGAAAGLVLVLGGIAVARGQAPAIPNLAGKILTVTGPIDPSQAGPTLMHEHIFIEFKTPDTADGAGVRYDGPMQAAPAPAAGRQRPGGMMGDRPPGWNLLANFDEQLAEVLAFKKVGGGTIVDTTSIGLTRNPAWLRRVSERSGLHVVMGAGWYVRSLHPRDMDARTVEELTAIVVRDITVGAQGTNIRSGIIGEVGVGEFGPPRPLTGNELKSVRASARASRLTGAPITVHSFAPADEMQRVLDVIASEGVDLNHVVLGHTGTGNLAAMKRYTDRGAYIEFDYIGSGTGPDSGAALAQAAERLATNIKTLIDGGLTDRILVAHDVCTQPQLAKNGGGGFAYISTAVMPALKAKGVSDETIRTILVDNPRRVLTFVAPQAVVARSSAQPPRASRVNDSVLRAAAASPDEWLTYGRDYAETHYSPLRQIDTASVARLGLAWSWETRSPTEASTPTGAALQATPLVADGVMYGTLAWGVMFAVDARTGREKWRWDPEIPRTRIMGLCCGPKNRGVALYNGRVLAGLLDGRVVALEQETGKLVWSAQVFPPGGDMILTSAVRIVKGKVIVGSSGAEHGVRGEFSAWDATTGKLAWRFYTVPGDPSKGFEHPELEMAAKTWTGEWWKVGGGGTVWDAMAYDPEADLLYVGTGNGSPWNINYRSPGGGDNLFLASILAVRPDTGCLVWHFQTVPGDTWDFTATQPLMLADLTIGGRPRKVIMQAPKNGFFYVLDRLTGEFISGEKIVKRMTWATGLDPRGRPIEAPGARFTNGPIRISPGAAGAHNWEPMSYHPGLGLVFIPGQETASYFVPDPNFRFQPGFWSTGMMVGRRAPGLNGDAPLPAPPFDSAMKQPEGADRQPEASGAFLVAWDPVAQKERWRVEKPGGRVLYGGTLATAGNLVFHGAEAYNATTGEKLWSAPVGNFPATPMTYMLDGRQYVTVLARNPGGRVFTFVLDGAAPMPEPPPN